MVNLELKTASRNWAAFAREGGKNRGQKSVHEPAGNHICDKGENRRGDKKLIKPRRGDGPKENTLCKSLGYKNCSRYGRQRREAELLYGRFPRAEETELRDYFKRRN